MIPEPFSAEEWRHLCDLVQFDMMAGNKVSMKLWKKMKEINAQSNL